MRNSELNMQIDDMLTEINLLLEKHDRESYLKILAILAGPGKDLIANHYGLTCLSAYIHIWMRETVTGEYSILEDVNSTEDIVKKHRKIRFAILRLENDFPLELCLEALEWLSEMQLSASAFQRLLPILADNEEKVAARIEEIGSMYQD